jgi:hypothetical protein
MARLHKRVLELGQGRERRERANHGQPAHYLQPSTGNAVQNAGATI